VQRWPRSIRAWDDDGNRPIHVAAKNEDLPVAPFRVLVELRPGSVRERNGDGRLPLHLVARRTTHAHTLGIVRYLLEVHPGSIYEASDGSGNLAVHEALLSQAPHEVIRLLVLRYPGCLMVWSGAGKLALHMAVLCAAPLETLTFLVEQCPPAVREVERDGGGGIALQRAAAKRRPSPAAMRLLIAAWPESVLVQDRKGRTALHICVNEAGISEDSMVFEAMQVLVEEGPGALQAHDAHGKIPLHILLAHKDPDLPVVRYLVEAWPKSVLVPTLDGSYALFLAAANSDIKLDVLYYLVKQWPGHYFVRQR
jgi:ankyrin repeat protein